MPYILALDQGTTSSRAILFDSSGAPRSVAQKEFPQIFPKPGWVEHDPEEIWQSQIACVREALEKCGAQTRDIAAIGITNQRETTVVWDRETGKPVSNAIVWQDRRTAEWCQQIRDAGHEQRIREKTGLLVDAYFSASKIVWILENVPGALDLARAGRLAFGTVDSWLISKLTGGKLHITDASNASRTMIFNIHEGQWDRDLLDLFGIPAAMLPEVRDSSEVYGEAAGELAGVPVAGIAGDQQAALFGQICWSPGMSKNTYGTGCFMLQHTGTAAVASKNRLLTTIAWRTGGKTEYALEGSVFIGGAVVQWLRDGLGVIRKSVDVEALAGQVEDSGGVYLVPAFAGLGAPYWDPYARGVIAGITRGTTQAHIARAAVDSIAYQVADLLEAMKADVGRDMPELRVDGGAAGNNGLLQFQADLLQTPVVRPKISETTALGAAYLAGLAAGFWKSREEIAQQWQMDRRFEPKRSKTDVERLRAKWKDAVERARNWERA
jgi:glycerol kinase